MELIKNLGKRRKNNVLATCYTLYTRIRILQKDCLVFIEYLKNTANNSDCLVFIEKIVRYTSLII